MPVRFEILDRHSEACRMPNEDAAGATATPAWVIDGTKGPFDHRLTPGASDAAWHAEALNAALAMAFADMRVEPSRALREGADALARTYAANALPAPAHEQPSACLALVALDAEAMLRVFTIGDCRIIVEGAAGIRSFGTSAGIERLEKAAIAEITRLRAVARDQANDPWVALRETVRRNFETAMNRPGGYWVVHPSLPWLDEVQQAALPSHDGDHVLIASDGFFRLVNVFDVYEARGLLTAARAKGLAALCAELRACEADDPTCGRYLRLKPMDDATAVLLRVRTG